MEPLDQYTRADVGLIGVGLLGSAIGRRWLKAGFSVTVFDNDRAKVDALIADGARGAETPQMVFASSNRVALALPHSVISARVLAAAEVSKNGQVVLDMTTGDPAEMAAIAGESRKKGIRYCDTTIGGSSAEAAAGSAIIMAGGEQEAFESCRDLLELVARRIFWLGPAGSGARMKLALNLVLGLNRAVLAEGLGFAKSCGIDPALALEVFRSGPAYSRVMDTKGEKMLCADFVPQARLAQHRKDVDLILQEAARHSAHAPFSRLHRNLLVLLEQAGYGGEDNSAIIRAFAEVPTRAEPPAGIP